MTIENIKPIWDLCGTEIITALVTIAIAYIDMRKAKRRIKKKLLRTMQNGQADEILR